MTQEICLANLATKTEQEVFDYVARHLLTQNRKAQTIVKDAYGYDCAVCKYRTQDNLRCAAGCLIADDEYRPYFEGASWLAGMVDKKYAPAVHVNLISRLQAVHDECPVGVWFLRLEELASDYMLEFNKDKLCSKETK